MNGRPVCAVTQRADLPVAAPDGLPNRRDLPDRRGHNAMPDVEVREPALGVRVAAVLRRVVVALAGEKRRLIVDGLAPGPRRAQPEAVHGGPLSPHLQRVIDRRRLGLDEQHVAVARNRTPLVDRTRRRTTADSDCASAPDSRPMRPPSEP